MSMFALIDAAARRGGLQARRGLKPIDFEIGSSPRVVWSFDPANRDRMFLPRRHPKAALTLACSGAFLGTLLSPGDLAAKDIDDLIAFGDLSALEALIAALVQPRSPISVRIGEKS